MNNWLYIIIGAYGLLQLFWFFLEILNFNHVKKHGAIIPVEFQGYTTEDLMQKSAKYTLSKIRFGIISHLYLEAIAVIFIFGGILNWYNNYLLQLQHNYDWSFVLCGTIFIMVLSYAKTILATPFNFYQTFKLEQRFGFNASSVRLWFYDLLKGLLISTLLISLLVAGALWIVNAIQNFWWLSLWGFFFIFTFFVIYLAPYVLEPLFNKFTPLTDHALAKEIKEMLKKAGIKVKGVYSMDASKRTKHSNAYFTGVGKVKRIVIFDTLLNKLSKDELLAVLAHEAGHCRKRHVLKNLLIFEVISALGAFLAHEALKTPWLSEVFQLDNDTFFAKIVIFSFVASIVIAGMPLLFNSLSRKFEREADNFAVKIVGSSSGLISALIKLSTDNLANLHPQNFYAKFHYSHPPILARIKRLKKLR